jgi:hypothetical protein
MKNEIEKFNDLNLKNKIYSIRGYQVMLDRDLAELYEVETRVLNQAVKRNIDRFPSEFCFKMTLEEIENLKSQFVISSWGGRRIKPTVFTEHGVVMLSSVLRSDKAISINIQVVKAFLEMRKFINSNLQIFQRLDRVEQKQIETDSKFEEVFSALEMNEDFSKQGIFFEGQIFDAYKFISDLFRKANKSILILDNFIDDSVLMHLSKKNPKVKVKILTDKTSNQLKLDLVKFEKQYFKVEVVIYKKAHDRFIILDSKEVYHIGASIKDLGKKLFGFSKMDKAALDILNKIEEIN